ncbi:hypothetical protein E4633_07380 [Geomonas terrae]|uniref:Uncharacterized protein n=1 Tax=Geomonas terrae TaxID=2562681 RepID=A0A4S1CFM6_9BACT|nr:hypothetical protein [Geomonas terrae]TGU72133.1 hypothetical protein E4633_07380 [Geomonas terrae]
MLHLRYKLSGKTLVVLGDCQRYYGGLATLSLYKKAAELAVPLEVIGAAISDAEQKYRNAINYDRVAIVMRNQAFKVMIDLFKNVAAYLQVVATEDDIPALLQAGLEVIAAPKKKRTTTSSPD